MMGYIDLHTHSTFSDGSFTPAELVEQASLAGLKAFALTDHDTVSGLAELDRAAESHPELEAIGGVELSTRYNTRELHIVGLWVDKSNSELNEFLEEMRRNRAERNEAMRRKLNSLGYQVSWDEPEFALFADTASIGRIHFARVLMRKYNFPSLQKVFDKLLKHNCPAFVARQLPEPGRAIKVIHAAGGVAVWAHPIYRQRNERGWARRCLKRLTAERLDALEAFYSMFGPEETKMLTELAETYQLALSGGSDYHGKNTPELSIGIGHGGLRVPAELLSELRKRRNNNNN